MCIFNVEKILYSSYFTFAVQKYDNILILQFYSIYKI